jgi:peptide/nickel transport system permease protein
LKRILQKLGQGLGVLWGALTLVFILFALIPDPARQLAGQNEQEEVVEAIREKYGLNQSPVKRYLHFFTGLSPLRYGEQGWIWGAPDLGRSFVSDRPVTEAIFQSLPATILLAILAMTLAMILGLAGGLICGSVAGSFADRLFLTIASLGMSAPSFVMAIVVSWLFGSVWHAWTGLPMTGGLWEVHPFDGPRLAFRHAILPAVTLGIRPLSVVFQLTRNSVTEILGSSYVRTAKSKGLSKRRIMTHHVLRNALNPVLTAASGWFASMLAGAVFVEYVFGWQGMGLLMFRALEQSDLPMVMGCVAVIAGIFVLVNLFVDLLYGWIDPRVSGADSR